MPTLTVGNSCPLVSLWDRCSLTPLAFPNLLKTILLTPELALISVDETTARELLPLTPWVVLKNPPGGQRVRVLILLDRTWLEVGVVTPQV